MHTQPAPAMLFCTQVAPGGHTPPHCGACDWLHGMGVSPQLHWPVAAFDLHT